MNTELFTAEEIAEKLNIKPSTLMMWGRQHKIPRVKVSHKIIRYNYEAVKKALLKMADKNRSKNAKYN